MSSNRKSTQGRSEKKKLCIKEVKVTDQFQKMMTEVLEATKKVLAKRQKDLSDEGWTNEKQDEFETIFGFKGSDVITIDSNEEKEKIKLADPETDFDPYIEKRERITAYQFMKEGVDRLIFIAGNISVENPGKEDPLLHGNFINKTFMADSSANVRSDQTFLLKPDLYKKTLRVNICQNFVCKPLTGPESQVSTLCHELSHFYRNGVNGEYGGLGTDDIPTKGGFGKEKHYVGDANKLRDAHNQYVFKNAYNIERYFELQLNDE
ncbi:TPA: hypothetical protein MYR09_004401 [Citrobacter farmeri]|uniref:hypothetical protein n=1 Tax=Citrobacter farmeri TaxID=67824 RepID=UPI00388E54E1|nr:hypothetical protein [Citrobacter farmeri]